MAHPPLPPPGMLIRLLIAGLALLPLLIVVVCSVPALVLGPFLPVTRVEVPKRIHQYMVWTGLILRTVLGRADDPRRD